MSSFDSTSPAQSHGALSDVDNIRNNTLALRDHESSAEASPPSNPVAGMFHHTSDTEKIYQRTNAGGWLYLWSVSDPPAKSSDLTTHTGANITSSVTVHGIRQGSGNGFDADRVDGLEASAFLGTSHGTATSGIHGAGSGVLLSAPTTTPFLVIASTAPTGWTQSTSWNDRVIRIVNGTGGGTGGTASPSGGHSHTYTGVVAHTHTITDPGHNHSIPRGSTSGNGPFAMRGDYSAATSISTGNSGTGITINSTGSASRTTDNTATAYLDVIAVTKNA